MLPFLLGGAFFFTLPFCVGLCRLCMYVCMSDSRVLLNAIFGWWPCTRGCCGGASRSGHPIQPDEAMRAHCIALLHNQPLNIQIPLAVLDI